MKKLALSCLAILSLLAVAPSRSQAAFVFTATEVGNDVVIAGVGTLDLTDLSYLQHGNVPDPHIATEEGILYSGSPGNFDAYYGPNFGLNGPTDFGSGDVFSADASTGDLVGIAGFAPAILVPAGYQSGGLLVSSMTFDNQSFASLGLTPGTYTYTWGTGADADSIVLTTSAVPEPSTWAMLGMGLAGMGMVVLRCRSRVV